MRNIKTIVLIRFLYILLTIITISLPFVLGESTWFIGYGDENGSSVLDTSINKFDNKFVLFPTVIKDNGLYKMWYNGGDNPNGIGYAISEDGIHWEKVESNENNGAIISTNSGNFDERLILTKSILKENSKFKMWYTSVSDELRIGYATSVDGITWEKYNGSYENGAIYDSRSNEKGDIFEPLVGSVIKEGSIYKMWVQYNIRNFFVLDQKFSYDLLISQDGINWEPVDEFNLGKSVLFAENEDFANIEKVINSVLKDGDTYKMWFSGVGNRSINEFSESGLIVNIGYAESDDGLLWNIKNCSGVDGSLFSYEKNRFDTEGKLSPSVIKDGNNYKMWYVGTNNSSYKIGYAYTEEMESYRIPGFDFYTIILSISLFLLIYKKIIK